MEGEEGARQQHGGPRCSGRAVEGVVRGGKGADRCVGVVVTVSGQGGPSLIVPATENAGGVEQGQVVRGARG